MWLGAMHWASRRLAVEEGIDPCVNRGEVAGLGVLNLPDPVARAERPCHRLGLEDGLAPEQLCDGSARFAVVGPDRVSVEAGKRTNRDRALVEYLRILLDLLQHDEFGDLDVASTRRWLGQRRAPRL